MAKLGELRVYLTAATNDFDRAMARSVNRLTAFTRKVERFGKVGALAFAGMGAVAVASAAEFEQTTISFETMLQSAEKAGAMVKQLQAFSTQTPFMQNEVMNEVPFW